MLIDNEHFLDLLSFCSDDGHWLENPHLVAVAGHNLDNDIGILRLDGSTSTSLSGSRYNNNDDDDDDYYGQVVNMQM